MIDWTCKKCGIRWSCIECRNCRTIRGMAAAPPGWRWVRIRLDTEQLYARVIPVVGWVWGRKVTSGGVHQGQWIVVSDAYEGIRVVDEDELSNGYLLEPNAPIQWVPPDEDFATGQIINGPRHILLCEACKQPASTQNPATLWWLVDDPHKTRPRVLKMRLEHTGGCCTSPNTDRVYDTANLDNASFLLARIRDGLLEQYEFDESDVQWLKSFDPRNF